MFDNKCVCVYILSSKYFAKKKMNEESFWVMVGATPNGKAIRASHFKHLHVNIFFVKALEQVPTGAKSIIDIIMTGCSNKPTKKEKRMRDGF